MNPPDAPDPLDAPLRSLWTREAVPPPAADPFTDRVLHRLPPPRPRLSLPWRGALNLLAAFVVIGALLAAPSGGGTLAALSDAVLSAEPRVIAEWTLLAAGLGLLWVALERDWLDRWI